MQFDREDIIQIYLKNPLDLGLLSLEEQEMIINQADGHLRVAKGKAQLPQLKKNDIFKLFEVFYLFFF
jgi:hypothetical protein